MHEITYRWPEQLGDQLGRDVIALYNEVAKTEDILGYPSVVSEGEGTAIVSSINGALHRRETKFFGIFSASHLIGMALLTPNPMPNCRHIVEWSKGIIHPNFQGRGILRSSMIELTNACLADGLELITLDVRENSRAHRLWMGLGFQQYGRLPDYARIRGSSKPGVYLYASGRELLARLTTSVGVREVMSNA